MATASTPSPSRDALIAALNIAMRETSGLGVLYSQTVAQRLGVTAADVECLDMVLLHGPVTAGALAEVSGLTTGAITGVIDRLEQAGLARRERDPSDRRKVLVRALPAALERASPLYEPMGRAVMEALADYDDATLRLILEVFEKAGEAAKAALVELRSTDDPA